MPTPNSFERDAKDPAIDLRLVAGDFNLAVLNIREQPALRLPRKRFKSFIDKAGQEYGLIVLDCNPSSSFITLSALEVATHLLIPVKADRFALLGIQSLMRFINSVPTIGPSLAENTSIVLNDVGANSDQKVIEDLRSHSTYGAMVLSSDVKHSQFMMPKTDYNGFAADRKAPYRNEIREVLQAVANEVALRLGF